MERQQFFLGGQAVLEGVMMRSPCHYSVAVRRKTGEITSKSAPAGSILRTHKWLNIPFVRGIFALVEMMALGIKCLRYSTDIALEDDENLRAQNGNARAKPMDIGKTTLWIIICSLCFALLFKYTVFFALPNTFIQIALPAQTPEWLKHTLEGLARVGIFVLFLSALSLSRELRRVFEYHGAEHKVVNLVEAHEELTVQSAKRHSRIHRRCGTTFLFLVLVVGVFVFAMFGWKTWQYNLMIRFVTLPIVAGVAYEVIRLTRVKWLEPITRVLIAPGLIFQYLTTREPDDSQLEVALEAMKNVLNMEREVVVEFQPAPARSLAAAAAAVPFR